MALQLNLDNPYSKGYIIQYNEGDMSEQRDKLKYTPSSNDILHTVRDFDTLWALSYDKYGSSKYWWAIADVNLIDNPLILTPNTSIIIPDFANIK